MSNAAVQVMNGSDVACSIMCSKDGMVVDTANRMVTANCSAACGPTAVKDNVSGANPLSGSDVLVSCFAECKSEDAGVCELQCRQGDGHEE